jgi:hypothetical protein
VQCVKCPRSYHIPRNFKSTYRNTRARSYACTVMYCKLCNGGRSGCCL